jgi:hypothetical protein
MAFSPAKRDMNINTGHGYFFLFRMILKVVPLLITDDLTKIFPE